MLRDWLKCPQYSYNMHILHQAPIRKSPAMEEGILFHEAMALHMTNDGSSAMDLPSWHLVSGEARDLWVKHKLWLPINVFAVPLDWTILGTEIVLSLDTFQGRLDAIIRWNGKFWSLQWKTYEDGLLELQERVRLSWHEAAYQHLAEREGYLPWGGTILGACQKLPSYRLIEPPGGGKKQRIEVTDEDRINALTFHYLTRSHDKQLEMVSSLMDSLDFMRDELYNTSPHRRRNYDSCFGPFGRGRCPYFDVCHEGASLESSAYTTIEPRY